MNYAKDIAHLLSTDDVPLAKAARPYAPEAHRAASDRDSPHLGLENAAHGSSSSTAPPPVSRLA